MTTSNLLAIVPGSDYLAQCRFSSTEETRYYLCGVFVDTANNRLVATDGQRLGLLAMGADMYTDKAAAPFILSANKAVMAAAKPSSRNVKTFLRCYADRVEVLEIGGGSVDAITDMNDAAATMIVRTIPASAAYVDGTFPAYEQVIPDSYAMTVSPFHSFNGRYMATFANPAAKGEPEVNILSGMPGTPGLVFNSDPRFLGCLMPMRGLDIETMRARAASLLRRPAPPKPALSAAEGLAIAA